MMNFAIVTWILFLVKIEVSTYDIRMPHNQRSLSIANRLPVTNLALQHRATILQTQCYLKNLLKCSVYPKASTSNKAMTNIDRSYQSVSRDQTQNMSISGNERTAQISVDKNNSPLRRMIDQKFHSNTIPFSLHGKLNGYLSQNTESPSRSTLSSKINLILDRIPAKLNEVMQIDNLSIETASIPSSANSSKENINNVEVTTATIVPSSTVQKTSPDIPVYKKFSQSLDSFERKFYATTFSKLSSISSATRQENGMSYVQSGLFLLLALMALSTEVGPETRREIDECLGLNITNQERLDLINTTISTLPVSSDDLKFRWSSRLVLRSQNISEQFRADAARVLRLRIDSFNGTETPKEMADALNQMVEVDSGGAIHNTFEEDELSSDVRAVLVSTLYLRARWRSAPTLLNGTRLFRDAGGPRRAARMIRVNDHMRYARLDHWDAEALEIFYSTPGLSVLMLVPRGTSLRSLVAAAVNTSLSDITARMQPLRVAATLPLYTLRMTLLLPNKLQAMNISRLVEANNGSDSEIRLSLAVQRIMFWAEAGRNAFKDDGLEWDEPPQQEMVVDRPYIFYVRWKNKTILNGNFVL